MSICILCYNARTQVRRTPTNRVAVSYAVAGDAAVQAACPRVPSWSAALLWLWHTLAHPICCF
jgi:hypothetical protein